jgi:hypothetical protein
MNQDQTFTTKSGHVVTFIEYLTGGQKRAIDRLISPKEMVITQETGTPRSAADVGTGNGRNDGSRAVVTEEQTVAWLDKKIETCIVSIDGINSNVVVKFWDMRAEDCEQVIAEINTRFFLPTSQVG